MTKFFNSFKERPTIWIGNFAAFAIVFASTIQFANAQTIPASDLKTRLIEYLWVFVAAILVSIAGYVSDAIKNGITKGLDAVAAYCANTQITEVLTDIKDFAVNESDKIEKLVVEAYANDNKISQEEINLIVNTMFKDFADHYGANKIAYLEKFRPTAEKWIKEHIEAAIRNLIISFREKLSPANTIIVNPVK